MSRSTHTLELSQCGAEPQPRDDRWKRQRRQHLGYTLPVICPPGLVDDGRADLERAFDKLHAQVYGQSAPNEDAAIVTFRLQSEIDGLLLEFPPVPAGVDGERALKSHRKVFDLEAGRFVDAG